MEDNSKEIYVHECAKRVDLMVQEATDEIEAGEKELAEISVRIVEITRNVTAQREKLAALRDNGDEMKARFALEYEKLLDTPKVIEVKAEKGLISVATDTIFIEYEGRTYELGDYRIDLYTDGRIKIVNLRVVELTGQDPATHGKDGWGNHFFHHPHVFKKDGSNVCLGNIKEGVYDLMGRHEYAVVIQLLIALLGTVKVTTDGQYTGYLTRNWKPMEEEVQETTEEGAA